jgi:hypothetical protein
MEENEQFGHLAGHFETVVCFECIWYEQLVLLLLFLATVVNVVLLTV